jgi:hypothetical protein
MLGMRIQLLPVAMVLLAALTACGSQTSPTSSIRSKADFCRTFASLSSRATPRQAADRLAYAGTPRDMDSSARQGLQVLVDHLRELPDDTKPADVTTMVRDLRSRDAGDVRAFVTYVAHACHGFAPDAPS